VLLVIGALEVAKNLGKIEKAFEFFCSAEKSKSQFTLEDICNATGWALHTVRSYQSKKWRWFLRSDGDKLVCVGISNYPKNSFFRIHSQQIDDDIRNLRPRFNERVDILIDKAKESAMLAVQCYNNPLALFRTPGYLVLMNIAFTALFHAIFEYKGIDYVYKNTDGMPKIIDGEEAAWELSECAKHYFQGKDCPERKNLEFLTKLRNKVEHRFLPQLDITVSGQCQAMLFNFEAVLTKEFSSFFALGHSFALALQFSQVEPFQREAVKRIQSKEYDTIRQFIDTFQSDLSIEIFQSSKYAFRAYLIPKVGNRPSSSDIAIEFISLDSLTEEEKEQITKQITLIKEKQVQVANQGKFKPSQVIKRVREETGVVFNTAHHTNAWKFYKVRPSMLVPNDCQTEFCQYDEPHRDFIYTERWVQFLIEKVRDGQEFEKIKSYKLQK